MSATDTLLPLSDWEILNTSDPARACAHLSDLFRPHQIITPRTNKHIDFKHNRAELSNSSMNAVSYGKEVTIKAKENSDNYLVVFTLRGASQVKQCQNSFETTANTVCVLNPTQPLEDHMSEDCDMLILQLAGHSVRQMLMNELGHSLKTPLEFIPVSLELSGSVASYAKMVRAVCDDINRHDSGLKPSIVNRQIEQMLISLLLTELPHSYSNQFQSSASTYTPGFMHKIDDYIEAHLSDTISLEELAVLAKMSVRNLQKSFHRYKGLSPMVYLRNARLAHARKLLLSTERSVTEVAILSGFSHMSRFACYYKERYGELPSETGKSRIFLH